VEEMPKVKDAEIKKLSVPKRVFIADLKKACTPVKSSPKPSET
jgi:hypothetical protein